MEQCGHILHVCGVSFGHGDSICGAFPKDKMNAKWRIKIHGKTETEQLKDKNKLKVGEKKEKPIDSPL